MVKNKKPMPYHCGACRKYFSVKIGTIMESSRIPLKTWLLVTYMMTTARKGISSCQISREIGITQKTAWFMLQRIRESWATENNMFSGEIEIDEAYFGGKEKNKHAFNRIKIGRETTGKVAVVAIRSRKNANIKAFSISETNKKLFTMPLN
ncbi:hypothetical protein KP07_01745 [Candidatus Liberibacter solanacearum]|nr:hypothetical protein KP07_01745 [Candidatus Liberibacter solanacearum]